MDPFEWLVEEAERLNEWERPAFQKEAYTPPEGDGSGGRPGDDFNRRGSWDDVLGGTGWRKVGSTESKDYWKRPGKDSPGWSATTRFCKSERSGDLLYVFTTGDATFEAERAYSKFTAYTLLHHKGDFSAAARQLRADGYGEEGAPGARVHGSGSANGRQREAPPDADTSADPLDGDATAADLIAHNAVINWAWEGWLPIGSLTILASEPGVGKTRLCADLLRRVNRGLPWPDGKGQTFPRGATALWVAADNQHAELGSLPAAFGFPPEALYVNATRRNPFVGTMLDDGNDLAPFERRIARLRPALVFVDTSLNATDRTAHKPEDAKAFFVPLQQIAARQQVVLVCVTHLNAAGKPLGRRIEGQGRVVLMLERPDPEGQEHRRKFYVRKSHSLYPKALGVTMGGTGNEYDDKPPAAPDGPRVRAGSGDGADCRAWLQDRMAEGPQPVQKVRAEGEKKGFSPGTLYRAKDDLRLEEYKDGGKKWWRFPRPEDMPADPDA